jgi:DNA-binding NarL/FixJ family response regulator
MLTVFIATDSYIVGERLGILVSDLEDVRLIGRSGTAEGVLDVVPRLRPDVMILDGGTPGRGCLRTLGLIKRSISPPIVIVITAFPYPQYREKCMQVGADYVFDTVVEFAQFVGLLKNLQREHDDVFQVSGAGSGVGERQ